LGWQRFSIAILLRTQWDYQRQDSQNESIWRASEYDQYLHQHQQLSMRTTNEAHRTLHIKDVRKTLYSQKRWPYESQHNWEALWAATTSEARMMHEQAL